MAAAALKKTKIERDQFTEDGVRLFNPSKPHGVVYSDGFTEVKFIQEYEGVEVHYRGDGAPVGYKKGLPLPKTAPELLTENEQLQARLKDLEDANRKINEMLARLLSDRQPGENPEAAAPKPQPLKK